MPAPSASLDRPASAQAALPALPEVELAPTRTDGASWRWVRWMVGCTVLACVAIATFNVVIDPTGKLGTGMLDPISRLARDRAAKVELLERHAAPRLVVLGTSRAKQLDPRELDPSADAPVNAALVGGDLFEERVLATWLGERADDDDRRPFPHLVVGVDVEGFRGRSLRGSGLLAVPAVRGVARRAAGSPSWVELAPDAGELLLSLETTRASWRTMRLQLRQRRTMQGHLHGEDATVSVADFDPAGLPRETRAWLEPAKVPALARHTHAAILPSIGRYRSNYEDAGAKLDPASIEDLRALVRVAVEHGDRPLVFITPAHERFAHDLDPIGRSDRHARVVALLRELADEYDVAWVDCSTCVPSRDELWLDGAHTSPLGSTVLAEHLAEAQAPSATPTLRSGASR